VQSNTNNTQSIEYEFELAENDFKEQISAKLTSKESKELLESDNLRILDSFGGNKTHNQNVIFEQNNQVSASKEQFSSNIFKKRKDSLSKEFSKEKPISRNVFKESHKSNVQMKYYDSEFEKKHFTEISNKIAGSSPINYIDKYGNLPKIQSFNEMSKEREERASVNSKFSQKVPVRSSHRKLKENDIDDFSRQLENNDFSKMTNPYEMYNDQDLSKSPFDDSFKLSKIDRKEAKYFLNSLREDLKAETFLQDKKSNSPSYDLPTNFSSNRHNEVYENNRKSSKSIEFYKSKIQHMEQFMKDLAYKYQVQSINCERLKVLLLLLLIE
jgi:hypothetical protein